LFRVNPQNPKGREGRNMAEVKMPHPGHEKHLCYLQNLGYLKSNLEDYKKLEHKNVIVEEFVDRGRAYKIINDSIILYKEFIKE